MDSSELIYTNIQSLSECFFFIFGKYILCNWKGFCSHVDPISDHYLSGSVAMNISLEILL